MTPPKGNENFGLLRDMIARMRQGATREQPMCWSAAELTKTLIDERGDDYMTEYLEGKEPVSVVRSYLSTNTSRIFSSGTDGKNAVYAIRETYVAPWE
jgi:hypothetical protein